MSPHFDWEARKSHIEEWHNSDVYKQLCGNCCTKFENLFCIGQQLFNVIVSIKEGVARWEASTGSDLHRGVYCPSPILDIVIGNVKRGRILKRTTNRSKITHRYGFAPSGMLVCCEHYYNNNLTETEYILPKDDTVLGITVGLNGVLTEVSEENYEGVQLRSYTHAIWMGNHFRLYTEHYTYDNNELSLCDVQRYESAGNYYTRTIYQFNRQDGYLAGYQAREYEGDCRVPSYWDDHVFVITKKQKATPPFFDR